MRINKEERKKYKNIIKKIRKKLDESPLNYFIKNYYYSLKESELPSAKINVINRIKTNKIALTKFKDNLNSGVENDVYNETIEEKIYDLQYQNNTAKEIIKFINLRKNEFYYEKKLKNELNFFKKILNCRRLFSGF
ncbi:MAG: hypothetical protein J6D28_00945 [Bacilli bacterium]|nr:hypothetical protein [Bacilli bacterium]MBP3920113.1 hypothetical protein [Bacilli bacterium]